MDFRGIFSRKEKEITLIKESEASKRKIESSSPRLVSSQSSPQPSAPQLRQPSKPYSYAEARRASPPATRPAPPSSNSSLHSSSSSPLSSILRSSSQRPSGSSSASSGSSHSPSARPPSSSSGSSSSVRNPAMGGLLSSMAKESMAFQEKKKEGFVQSFGPTPRTQTSSSSSSSSPALRTPSSSSSSSSAPRAPNAKQAGITGLFSSMAQESIAYQEKKKEGFVQSFGPTPREQPASSPSSSVSAPAAPKPAGGYASLFSNIAKEGISNKENKEFIDRKFGDKKPTSSNAPASAPALRTPSSSSSSSSYSAARAPNAKQAGISGLFSSLAQESISFQEEKKKGFVQSFGPTPREGMEAPVAAIIRPSALKEKSEKPELSKRDIVWLQEMSKKDVLIGGGKGANLAEMYNLKLPVPPAFIVSAHAYQDFIEKTGLRTKLLEEVSKIDIQNTVQLETKAKEIREMVIATPMPRELSEEIIEAYDDLSIDREVAERANQNVLSMIKSARDPVFVAIRSSATSEDSADASFAGQQETFLNVKGREKVLESVKQCWASLFTARAIYYRRNKGFKEETTYIAVVVQKMINSDKSGITFTINPSKNSMDEIVIESVFGLGEGIVSGTIAPDRYIVDKKTMQIKEVVVANKPIFMTRNRLGENITADIPPENRNDQVLDIREILKIANYGRQLEEHYGIPQDSEWAIENNDIFIVQTRPITTYKNIIKKIELSGTPILEGLAASPGIAHGKVKIINSLTELSKIEKGDILVTKMTNPDMVVTMQKSNAIITDEGGMTCHAAIVSREMGIPAIVGTRKATSVLQEGQIITVDAYTGKIYDGEIAIPEAPKEEAKPVAALTIEETPEEIEDELLKGMDNVEHVTIAKETPNTIVPVEKVIETPEKTGVHHDTVTKVYMNLSEPNQIERYSDLPFEGIGLLRLEFMISSQIGKHPLLEIENGNEEEYILQISRGISHVASSVNKKPVIVRFSDFKSNEYKDLEGGDKYETPESNPMIGFRGVSRYVSPEFEKAFRLECKAIIDARKENKNIHVMLPFVRTVEEVAKCLEIMKSEGLERSKDFRILLMAEVPSMAIIPEEFAKLEIDGVSIGSNDLTQLVLGVDRDSAILGRAGYFDERNKAVLTAIHNIIKGFKKFQKTVGICGQAPSVYPEYVDFLINQGIDSISVNPDVVSSVRKHVSEVEKKILLEAARKKQGKNF